MTEQEQGEKERRSVILAREIMNIYAPGEFGMMNRLVSVFDAYEAEVARLTQEQEKKVAEAHAAGIGVGRLSGDVLAAELRGRMAEERYGRWHHAGRDGKCLDDCPACERRGLRERVTCTESFETLAAALASLPQEEP
jgi:hypothetical protein